MRAGELAMRALDNFAGSCEAESEEEEEDGDPERRTQLMLFLWSVKNTRMTKVNLSNPPDNDIVDRVAQSTMRKLDKPETLAEEENPKEKVGSPSAQKKRSTSPSDRSRDGRTDRTQSVKPPHASPDGSPLAKFRDKGRQKRRRDPREGRKKGKRKPIPSPPSSDQSSGSSSESDEEGSREPMPPRKSFSKSPGSRSRSQGKSLIRSRSRSSRTKSIRNDDSDSSSQESNQTRKSKRNKSPPSSSPGSSSGDSSDGSDDSGSSRPRKGTQRSVQKKRRRRKRKRGLCRNRARTRRRDSSSSDEERNLHKAMVRSLQAMTSSQLKRDQKEDKKKSMLSRLSPEGGSLLFKLLSAKNWKDGNPKLPAFTKKILEDRDSNRAIGEMKTIWKRWSGKISEKGILSFLANGYAADDISDAPGGFSIFMFSPLGAHKSSDQKSRILQVRSMFGSAELDEDSTKYFAKNDFCLADNLPGLEEQICTCIKLLEKLTCKDGIASEGYRLGFKMLGQYKKEFLDLTRMDPLFPVKFAYLLDRAFQNFVLDLGDHHNSEDPILRARRALKGQQVQDTEAAMSGFKTGSLSKLFFPRTLQTESSSKGDHPSKDEGSSGAERVVKRGRSGERKVRA
jgi:hypothetical protein